MIHDNFKQILMVLPTYILTKIPQWDIVFERNQDILAVEDFIFKLERLQAQYNCPWPDIVRESNCLVKGEASDRFWLYLRSNPLPDWVTLRQALLHQFQNNTIHLNLIN